MNIKEYGLNPAVIHENEKGIPARITAVHRNKYEFICENGTGLAQLKTGRYYSAEHRNEDEDRKELFPTTGDFVMLDWQKNGVSLILTTLPRKTFFSRLDPSSSGHKEQAVAANFDYVFIMQSLNNDFNLRRLERYLTIAWQSGAVPVVVLTKSDCVEDFTAQVRATEKIANNVGVFAVSAKTGYGIDSLSYYLKAGKTIVFLGSSGVGKSSLVNALAGEGIMNTNDVRKSDSRGKHTTTHRQLIMLNSGVMIIDTPGMRELGMWDISQGAEKSFSDIEQYFGHCKFNDCKHQTEPGCAITEAIRSGELSSERWQSYLKLNKEAKYTDNKAGYLSKKRNIQKEIAVYQKQKKEPDYRNTACTESFTCMVCGAVVVPEEAGSQHRNHCPHCLSSVHVDNKSGDRSSLCKGIMDAVGVWVRKNGEWAIIHRCRLCGTFNSNRIAADDNQTLLMSIAVKPLSSPPFPLWNIEDDKSKLE